MQETYLRALTHWNDVEDLSRSQCRAWLYKTARNLYIDQMRKLSREVSEEEELKALPFEEDLSQSAVRQLVARLPNTERLLFSMRYFEGYNSQELGKLFDLPAATVRSRLASASGGCGSGWRNKGRRLQCRKRIGALSSLIRQKNGEAAPPGKNLLLERLAAGRKGVSGIHFIIFGGIYHGRQEESDGQHRCL